MGVPHADARFFAEMYTDKQKDMVVSFRERLVSDARFHAEFLDAYTDDLSLGRYLRAYEWDEGASLLGPS